MRGLSFGWPTVSCFLLLEKLVAKDNLARGVNSRGRMRGYMEIYSIFA